MEASVKAWLHAALVRAIRTSAQSAVAMIPAASQIADVSWATVVSTAIVAGLLSILTSVATGLPEAKLSGTDD